MFNAPKPSPRTQQLWAHRARHAIRIELTILVLSLLALVFTIAQIALEYHSYAWLSVWNLPINGVTLIVSIVDIVIFSRNALHPVYSVCISTFFFAAWVAMLVFIYSADVYTAYYFTEGYYSGGSSWTRSGRHAAAGLIIVKDILYGVIMVTYLVYIGFSARAVDMAKKQKRESFTRLKDTVDLEAASRS